MRAITIEATRGKRLRTEGQRAEYAPSDYKKVVSELKSKGYKRLINAINVEFWDDGDDFVTIRKY